MIYHLGDKLIINGIECEVGYINNGNAWLFPLKDHTDIRSQYIRQCLAYAMIQPDLTTLDGERATTLTRCGAV